MFKKLKSDHNEQIVYAQPRICLGEWDALTPLRLTEQIKKKIYNPLLSWGIFLEEQKGCHKRTRGTEELQYIDQYILNETKTRPKNLAMALINYKKAYNMVPQSWILHCLKNVWKPYEVVQFIKKTTKTWRVELTAG